MTRLRSVIILAFALASLSCQKDETPEQLTIEAIAEQYRSNPQAEDCNVVWNKDFQIAIMSKSGRNTFSLSSGEGTPKGTFTPDGTISDISGETRAYYPSVISEGSTLVWPKAQSFDNFYQPMFCLKDFPEGPTHEDLDFSNLGGVIQIAFRTPSEDITLSSIQIIDGQRSMSGEFIIGADGAASISANDGSGITLSIFKGMEVNNWGTCFNIAVPVGDYKDLTVTFKTIDDRIFETKPKETLKVERNSIATLDITGNFKNILPKSALPGKFSVSPNHQVYFSRGNLYYMNGAFFFEKNQYDYATSINSLHLGHFC